MVEISDSGCIDIVAYKLSRIEPYFSAIQWVDSAKKKVQWGRIDPPNDPGQKFLLTLDLDIKFFERYAKFERHAKNSAWWESGMQRYIVGTVHAVSDDLDDGVFLLYSAMNNREFPVLLGRLVSDDWFTVAVANRLRDFITI